jgi:hypothetical protein
MQTTTQGRPSDAQDPPVDQCVCVCGATVAGLALFQRSELYMERRVDRQCDGRQRMAVVATTRLKR